MEAWRQNLIEDERGIEELLRGSRRIAVLGIKTEAQRGQPAFYVAASLQQMGLTIVPVPVYYPDVTEILGETVYRKLSDIADDVDMVNVFRRPQDIPPHTNDILASKPKSVWMQLGIYHDEVAEQLIASGCRAFDGDGAATVSGKRVGSETADSAA